MKKCLVFLFLLMSLMAYAEGDNEPKNLLHLTDESFDKAAEKSLIIVDFYADWCGPCRQFAPIFKDSAADLPEYTFVKINVDQCRSLSERYDIRFIPYIVAIKDGKVISKYSYSRGSNKTNFSKWVKSQK
ncbi:MAG: thioredoxin family protein [Spirochaetales bacterium]|nr:thioredoxin family protein [Spirochaetales bacterium]